MLFSAVPLAILRGSPRGEHPRMTLNKKEGPPERAFEKEQLG
jgi:hypothetical protein